MPLHHQIKKKRNEKSKEKKSQKKRNIKSRKIKARKNISVQAHYNKIG